jgi:hypothetical protein
MQPGKTPVNQAAMARLLCQRFQGTQISKNPVLLFYVVYLFAGRVFRAK